MLQLGRFLPARGEPIRRLTRSLQDRFWSDSQKITKRHIFKATNILQRELPIIISQEPENEMPTLVDCRQGQKCKNVFSKDEMNKRLETLRKIMVDKQLDVCIFTSIHNMNYYNQYVYLSMGRPYGLVVTMDKHTCISSTVDYGYAWRRGDADNISYTDFQKGNFFKAVLHLVGDGKKRIGVEYDHLDLQKHEHLKSVLPDASFHDVSGDVMKTRMVKSEEEIQLIRKGAKIAELGAYEVMNSLQENVMEHTYVSIAVKRMVDEIAEHFPHTDLMDTWCWVQSGYNSDGAHNPPTTRKIQAGDIIVLNCFPMIAGYFSAVERTLFFRHASDDEIRIWNINLEVHRRGLELIKPGVRCCDIAMELNEIYKKYNVLKYRTFGYGHSFGSLSYYYGREAGLELREDVETVLQPGMVLSMEPMLVIPDTIPGFGGYREHDLMVVTENGADNLTEGFPMGPEQMIVNN